MKKSIALILLLLILMASFSAFPLGAYADSLYIKKIVSVVYDDSTSMNGNKWTYANYAMQTFCGMLNEEDRLFITYMSDVDVGNEVSVEVDLSTGSIQKSVDAIRDHNDKSSTPYGTVETAFNTLKDVKDSNPNTQYWLVVITDGDFNEHRVYSTEEKVDILNTDFTGYAKSTMPNGSTPQINFMTIGTGVAKPDQDEALGIYTYTAQNEKEISVVMSKMADRISGRTRIDKADIKQLDDNTLQVSSDLPLLNIAVLTQDTDAVIEKAVYANEMPLEITRKAILGYSNLSGSALLIGDTSKVIGRGTYNFTFSGKISPDNVDILFEPALEVRMTVFVNGKEVDPYKGLDDSMEKDKITVSYKIYEMGTDTEVSPDLLPPGTEFEIAVYEDGDEKQKKTGANASISDYELDDKNTEIKAAVKISGFSPIEYILRFTPDRYVKKTVYTMTADFGGGAKSIKYDKVPTNDSVKLYFTVFADGKQITDEATVKQLAPSISTTPAGNNGTVSYTADGKIVYTPNTVSAPPAGADSFDVGVTCTLSDGTCATETYTVLLSEYMVIAMPTVGKVIKTEFFNNTVGASFYVTKDGDKLTKSSVEKGISVSLNPSQGKFLSYTASVAEDGTITVVPTAKEEHKLTFFSWFGNWWYYFFGVSGDDVRVTLNHSYGSAEAVIEVCEQTLRYQLLCVYLPLALELALLITLIVYIIFVVKKPKFGVGDTLYIGTIVYNNAGEGDETAHILKDMTKYELGDYNKIKLCFPPKRKYGIDKYGRLLFKRAASPISEPGIEIQAVSGGIRCLEEMPWYKGEVTIDDIEYQGRSTRPADIMNYLEHHHSLHIQEFVANYKMDNDNDRMLIPASAVVPRYIVIPERVEVIDGRTVIKKGIIFILTN